MILNFLLFLFNLNLFNCKSILNAIEYAKGIYNDKNKQIGFENTVLITAGNYGYLNHIHNFKCFADRLDIKFITFIFDEQGYKYLKDYPELNAVYLDLSLKGGVHTFREGEFNRISMGKMRAAYEVLSLGYNVIFADPDVVIVHDPFFIFNQTNMDYIHSVNVRCRTDMPKWHFSNGRFEHNTGFYYLRSRPWVVNFFHKFLASTNLTKPWLDDQSLFWKHINKHQLFLRVANQECRKVINNNPDELSKDLTNIFRLCHLDQCQFPAGGLSDYDNVMKSIGHEPLYTLHANYMHGNEEKYLRLYEKGYWLATKNPTTERWDGTCTKFSYPPKSNDISSMIRKDKSPKKKNINTI